MLVVGLMAARPAAAADTKGYANAKPTEVDVALVLAVDASQSMDPDEQHLQRDGYADAIVSKEVLAAIKFGRHGRIAVTYFEWGSADQQVMIAPWSIIDGPEAAQAFSKKVATHPLNNLQRTSISAALNYAGDLLLKSGLDASRRVIDVSGDGPNNQGPFVTDVRDRLVRQGITINGLPIVMKDSGNDWYAVPHLDTYYEDCVIGGEGAFSIPVKGMDNFGAALKMKLIIEIAGLAQDRLSVIPAAGQPMTNCRFYD
jgi:hypothetical protein